MLNAVSSASAHSAVLPALCFQLFIGFGFPYEGPAPLEAIANGCIFLQSRFSPPHSSLNHEFFRGKPTSREVSRRALLQIWESEKQGAYRSQKGGLSLGVQGGKGLRWVLEPRLKQPSVGPGRCSPSIPMQRTSSASLMCGPWTITTPMSLKLPLRPS